MLYELIKPYTSVSTIGMCKNAGKTTALNRLIAECAAENETVALTSVGRDGERSDVVTGTKKPEIFVYDGTFIATAAAALDLGDISREIVEATGMPTPMGEVIIARARSDGYVQLAGPSMTAQIKRLNAEFVELGAERIFIDGALSRKSLAIPSVSDAAILSTGASYSRDMKKTVEDTAHAIRLMSLEKTDFDRAEETSNKKFTLYSHDEKAEFDSAKDAAERIRDGGIYAVRMLGGITDAVIEAFFAAGRALDGVEFICEDGSRLLFEKKNFDKLLRVGARLTALERTNIAAVTVNAFSAYGDDYNAAAFAEAVREATGGFVPVIDVMEG